MVSDPSFRSYQVTRRVRKHAGFGLAIARTVVRGYGGTIAARNSAEGGACFEVRLPSVNASRIARET